MAKRFPLHQARGLINRHGRAATCWQLLNPGLARWYTPDDRGVVGYRVHRSVCVVAGEPVCAPERLATVGRDFERFAAAAGRRVCYLAAEYPMVEAMAAFTGYTVVPIGAQPVWRPGRLAAVFRETAALRYQLNRARHKGLSVVEWPIDRSAHPGLHRCLEAWLGAKALPALGFMTDPYLLYHMAGRRLWVAECKRMIVGYAILSPVPARRGWLVEQIVRGRQAPNGTAESLVSAAAQTLAAENSRFITLGAAPLSRRGPRLGREHPLWLRAVMAWMRAHGTRFYNFRGLERFKAKFRPKRWEPVYAVATEARIRPATLYAVLAAFTTRSPLVETLQALGRGLEVEIENMSEGLLKKIKRPGRRRDGTSSTTPRN